eukprot:CAMPEP_0198736364 /NCGR_PEP_ID=MMETSP1475-20131203/65311_1 /TAXON_ID= ORGANISM="Unidentified sp., Strain CCMP1999" /NCGR_SAMPLE_ID=MMETSP1475 /ASSEMBLY_ACC=CAM_ASM_001111 /LENGTH=399 /DNA_ID=CAMNT_0044500163 /DNA_START=263 /DNA_END=1459 /DNA_ORIENTATION=-
MMGDKAVRLSSVYIRQIADDGRQRLVRAAEAAGQAPIPAQGEPVKFREYGLEFLESWKTAQPKLPRGLQLARNRFERTLEQARPKQIVAARAIVVLEEARKTGAQEASKFVKAYLQALEAAFSLQDYEELVGLHLGEHRLREALAAVRRATRQGFELSLEKRRIFLRAYGARCGLDEAKRVTEELLKNTTVREAPDLYGIFESLAANTQSKEALLLLSDLRQEQVDSHILTLVLRAADDFETAKKIDRLRAVYRLPPSDAFLEQLARKIDHKFHVQPFLELLQRSRETTAVPSPELLLALSDAGTRLAHVQLVRETFVLGLEMLASSDRQLPPEMLNFTGRARLDILKHFSLYELGRIHELAEIIRNRKVSDFPLSFWRMMDEFNTAMYGSRGQSRESP